MQDIADALDDWSDGSFHAARQRLDDALTRMTAAIDTADLRVDSFMVWLERLRDVAADLQETRLGIEQAALAPRGVVGHQQRTCDERCALLGGCNGHGDGALQQQAVERATGCR